MNSAHVDCNCSRGFFMGMVSQCNLSHTMIKRTTSTQLRFIQINRPFLLLQDNADRFDVDDVYSQLLA